MIALTNADHAILLTGYTRTDITYIDPDTGEEQTVGVGEMEKMVAGKRKYFYRIYSVENGMEKTCCFTVTGEAAGFL